MLGETMKREKTTIYLNPELKKRAKHYAIEHNISLSDLVELAIKRMMEKK
jgi:post-segregation antitoxin (ccd killing protein)